MREKKRIAKIEEMARDESIFPVHKHNGVFYRLSESVREVVEENLGRAKVEWIDGEDYTALSGNDEPTRGVFEVTIEIHAELLPGVVGVMPVSFELDPRRDIEKQIVKIKTLCEHVKQVYYPARSLDSLVAKTGKSFEECWRDVHAKQISEALGIE